MYDESDMYAITCAETLHMQQYFKNYDWFPQEILNFPLLLVP